MQAHALTLAEMAGLVSFNTAFAATGGQVAMTARHDGTVALVAPAAANDNNSVRLIEDKPAKAVAVCKVAMDPGQMFAATNREFLPWA